MATIITRRGALQAAGAALAFSGATARAQDALDNLKILVGFPAGGTADVTARWLADKLAPSYARNAIVDNKPGAAGRIAIDLLKNAPPDGRTMLITPASTVTVYPYVYRQLSYDPTKDVTPVSLAATFVHGLAVGPMVPAEIKNLAQFAEWAKVNPGKANCGNPGEGSFPHFLTMLLARATGAPIQAVPYRGGAPAIADLTGGQLASLLLPEGAFLPFKSDGRARVLATSGSTRSPFYPDVATFAEQGVKAVVVTEWFGLFMPPNMPAALVTRASEAVGKVLGTSEVKEAFAKSGMVPTPSTPAQLAAMMKHETDTWGPLIRSTGFKPLE
jgi:tripartite-type tricarboxylate transporter receptor subunit TctC